MADEQVIKIRYAIDKDAVTQAKKELQGLDKETQDLVKDFRAVNQAATAATTSITNVGKKTDASMKQASKATKSAKEELSQFDKMASKVGASLIAYFSFQAITSLGKQIIQVTAEFEKFRAVLTNTLGSQAAADLALDLIQEFAATTNFSVQELTSSFIKLTNAGFQPTKDELVLLADLANSTGKSFDQLTEAILDANTFQFERLKEFGIKAEQAGNKIRFTFKGVTTEVAKTSDSVQQYLLGLGKLQGVAGSTAAISATLTGQISNLGDSFDQLLLSIGKQGRGGVSEAIGFLSSILGELKNAVTGQKSVFDPLIETLNGLWQLTVDLGSSISGLWKDFQNLFGEVEEGSAAMAGLSYVFKITLVPIKLLVLAIVTTIDAMKALGGAATNTGILIRNALTAGPGKPLVDIGIDKLKADAKRLVDILNLTDGEIQRNQEKAAVKEEETTKKKEKAKTAITKEEIDKRFAAEMSNLDKLEQLAIREAKIRIQDTEEEQREVLRIESEYQQKRIEIVRNYGKQNEVIGKENSLKQLEIFDEQAVLEIEAEKQKQAELARIRDTRKNENIAAIEDIGERRKLAQDVITNSEIEAAQQRYLSSNDLVNKGVEYEKQVREIAYQSTRKNILSEIELLEEKKDVKNQSDQEILKLDQEIEANKRKLLDLEFEKFKETEDKKTAKAKEEHEKRKQLAQDALNVGIEILNAGFEITQNGIDAEILKLQAKAKEDTRLAGDNAKAKEQIAAEAAKKEAALKTRQAQIDRQQAIFNIGITTALNVVKALGQPPIPGTNVIAAALAGAAGAAQLAVVLSKPIPKFNEGTASVPGVDTGKDSVFAMLRPKEAVIPVDKNHEFRDLIPGMISGQIKRTDLRVKGIDYNTDKLKSVIGVNDNSDILASMERMNKSIGSLKQVHVDIDRKGLHVFQKTQHSKVKFENRYFRG